MDNLRGVVSSSKQKTSEKEIVFLFNLHKNHIIRKIVLCGFLFLWTSNRVKIVATVVVMKKGFKFMMNKK